VEGVLDKMLRLLTRDGLRTTADLARELQVSEALVHMMIADLAQRGYLRPVSANCGGSCTACPLIRTCAVGGPGQVWAWTRRKKP
jgi:predicted ArsR family transcriptional regulator